MYGTRDQVLNVVVLTALVLVAAVLLMPVAALSERGEYR